MEVIQENNIHSLLFYHLAIPKRLNHRARAPIPIPDVPDEIFYKVNRFVCI